MYVPVCRLQFWNVPGLITGNGPRGMVVPELTIPSYLPVPVIVVRAALWPSRAKWVRDLSPCASIASHTEVPVSIPLNTEFIPTHLKVDLSKMPPGGLLCTVPVISKLNAVCVWENAMMLLAPDQQHVRRHALNRTRTIITS